MLFLCWECKKVDVVAGNRWKSIVKVSKNRVYTRVSSLRIEDQNKMYCAVIVCE